MAFGLAPCLLVPSRAAPVARMYRPAGFLFSSSVMDGQRYLKKPLKMFPDDPNLHELMADAMMGDQSFTSFSFCATAALRATAPGAHGTDGPTNFTPIMLESMGRVPDPVCPTEQEVETAQGALTHYQAVAALTRAARGGGEDTAGMHDWPLRVKMANALWRMGQEDTAIQLWQDIVKHDENFADALLYFGVAATHRGRPAEGIQILLKVLP